MTSTRLYARSRRRSFLLAMRLVLLTAALGHSQKQITNMPAGRFIVPINDSKTVYRGLVAAFGNELVERTLVNIMLPPSTTDRFLCELPPSISNASASEWERMQSHAGNLTEPVAILAAVGGPCTTEVKARVFLEMRQLLSPQLQVLLLYETEMALEPYFIALEPDTRPVSSDFDQIAIIYFPHVHMQDLWRSMLDTRRATGQHPDFLRSQNENWSYLHMIEGFWTPTAKEDGRNHRNSSNQSYTPNDDYFWIRYILFTVLIVSPCLRAAYLFYAGGGRLQFRRNQQGAVIGLQYVPPIPYWLSQGRPPPTHEPIAGVLTEVQFSRLPEIVYDSSLGKEDGEYGNHAEAASKQDMNDTEISHDDPELGSLPAKDCELLEPGPVDEAVHHDSVDELPEPGPVGEADYHDSNEATDLGGQNMNTSDMATLAHRPVRPTWSGTRCATCSICIDDFEDGEKLTLLPRCGHAFHKSCIMPWLLERQGCCPTCKTVVIPEGQEDTASDQSGESSYATARM